MRRQSAPPLSKPRLCGIVAPMRNSRFALTPEDVGIILTYRCHSRCAHCLYNCGPAWGKDDAMDSDTLRQALEAITLWPQHPQVHLTGGEPFLHFDLLLAGARIATELGISAYVETSASWCTDEDQARDRFQALRQAGLQAVLISCSPFHAAHIPPARTLQAIHAARQVFGAQRVMVYLAHYLPLLQRLGLEQPIPLETYEATYGPEEAGRLLWHSHGLISGGRAGYALGHLVDKHPAAAFSGETCAGELLHAHHSHFDLYGNYISGFCGGLAVGDWHDLPQVLDDFQAGRYPVAVDVLIEQGPYGLYHMAQRDYDYQPLEEGYTGKCHLCVDIRKHLVHSGDFPTLRPEAFYDHI